VPRVHALAGLVAAAFALLLPASGLLDGVEGQAQDARFALRGAVPADDVVVVDIEAESISRMGRWPIDRRWHARAVDRLRRAGARVVAYDVQFTEPSPDEASDLALYDAVGRMPGTVLSTTEVDDAGRHNVLGGDELLREVDARAGHTAVSVGTGGVVRRVAHTRDGLASFPVAAAERFRGRRVAARGFGDDGALIDFHGPSGTIPTYRFWELVRPGGRRIPRAALAGKVVVVGSSAPALQDLHPVPSERDGLMPGPEVQANAISTVLRGLPLRAAPGWAGVLAVLALALLIPLAAHRLGARAAAAAAVVALAGWLAGTQAAFALAGLVLPVAGPVLAVVLGAVGALGGGLVVSLRERRRTRHLFGRFVPEAVVAELLEREDGSGHIGGVRQDATVLFCDLRGFTAFAEGAEPELVIEVLNVYLSEMSDAILAEHGTVVSYLGDGIMAVFGWPVERPDHADAALRAAEAMLAVRLPRLNAWLAERGLPPFALGVGLNSGAVMSGTVGSERRMEYAAVGDTTNVAARLQAATKGTPHALFVAATTHERLGDDGRDRLAPAGDLPLRGRDAAVAVWAPSASAALDERDEAHGPGVAALQRAA